MKEETTAVTGRNPRLGGYCPEGYPVAATCKGCRKAFKKLGKFNHYCPSCQEKIAPGPKASRGVIRRHRTGTE